MTLQELSQEYRRSGEALRARLRLLEPELSDPDLPQTRRLALRRRVTLLRSMARDTMATARYLERYYGGEDAR